MPKKSIALAMAAALSGAVIVPKRSARLRSLYTAHVGSADFLVRTSKSCLVE